MADFALLSADYFAVADDAIADIHSELTVVDGRIVHGSGGFTALAPALPRPMPDWSPVNLARAPIAPVPAHAHAHPHHGGACRVHDHGRAPATPPVGDANAFWGALGCSCFAF